MKVIAVDIAFRKSGFVILEHPSGALKFSTTISINKKLSRAEALLSIYDIFEQYFAAELVEDHLLILEDVMTFGHLKAAVAIETARTAAALAYHHVCRRMEVRPHIIYATPGEVKGHFSGKRGAKKPELFEKFITQFPEYAALSLGEDEMDALILGLFAFAKYNLTNE